MKSGPGLEAFIPSGPSSIVFIRRGGVNDDRTCNDCGRMRHDRGINDRDRAHEHSRRAIFGRANNRPNGALCFSSKHWRSDWVFRRKPSKYSGLRAGRPPLVVAVLQESHIHSPGNPRKFRIIRAIALLEEGSKIA